jgi:hypothetical protein
MRKYSRSAQYAARDTVIVSVKSNPKDGKYAVRETRCYPTNIGVHVRNVTSVTIIGDYENYFDAKIAADEWYMDNVG